ncbi:MFS transporter [Nocardia abscessus]|uniref:MFS transporter n=1 Tax=Nocardia abscessus TaxID=120957 RepID=A0ABS0C3Y0_9NOCA|nr:MFS transporter [Nocardia abscessus]MBF6225094.1 MFS transporter [Nocardia abscessus]
MTLTAADARSGFALSTRIRVTYGLGSLATATYGMVPGLVLLHYLTNVLGVAAAVAGFVVLVPKLLDLVYNPVIGRLSDSTVSRLGPRRPWMIAGTVVLPLGFMAIFLSPVSGNGAAWWVGAALAVTGLGFSAFVIPYSVLPAELGASSEERTSMMVWRTAWLAVAMVLVAAVTSALAGAESGERQGYGVMALVISGLILVGAGGAIYSARRSTRVAVATESLKVTSLREALSAARRNRPFRVLLGVFVLIEVVISVTLAGLPYLSIQLLGSDSALAALFLCAVGPMLLTMPAWRRAAVVWDKKSCLTVALSILGAGALAVAALPRVEQSVRFEVACVAILIAGIGFAGAQILPQAMLADTLAADADESGHRRAGVLAGLWSAGETIGGAAGAGIYGFILAVSGFVSSTAGQVVSQPRSAQWGIVLGYAAISLVSVLAALSLLRRYAPAGDRQTAG